MKCSVSKDSEAQYVNSTVLVSMPFATFDRPSIQLGLLKAIGVANGFRVDTRHLNLDFVSLFGIDLYKALANHRGSHIGDWMFSAAAFGPDVADPNADLLEFYSDKLSSIYNIEGVDRKRLVELRDEVLPTMLDYIVETMEWAKYQAVGFTSTFQQNAASFALARRIKTRYPHISILFGGANFEQPMGAEWMRSIPWIDYAIAGDADRAFPELLEALFCGGAPDAVPGVLSRNVNSTIRFVPPTGPFADLDSLPTPDYGEYFDRSTKLKLLTGKGRRHIFIPFESSRGCWWGMKKHCSFCGLNGLSIRFRTKKASRVLSELSELSRRCCSFQFEAVDNIFDFEYFKTLIPLLNDSQATYDFFYEVKSNVNKSKIRQLALAGIRWVQPGIESLSTPVLKLMRKGVTAAQNVNMLRWCQHYGINALWNILWGFPGEKREYYENQAKLMRQLIHLRPPTGWGRIWMERFSPLFQDRKAFPEIKKLYPEPSYSYVYPEAVDLDVAAYFFTYQLDEILPDDFYAETNAVARAWKKRWSQAEDFPTLVHRYADGFLLIEDRRDLDAPLTWTFEEPFSLVYMSCNSRAQSLESIIRNETISLSPREVALILNEFVERGLLMRDDKRYLCLSLPGTLNG